MRRERGTCKGGYHPPVNTEMGGRLPPLRRDGALPHPRRAVRGISRGEAAYHSPSGEYHAPLCGAYHGRREPPLFCLPYENYRRTHFVEVGARRQDIRHRRDAPGNIIAMLDNTGAVVVEYSI